MTYPAKKGCATYAMTQLGDDVNSAALNPLARIKGLKYLISIKRAIETRQELEKGNMALF